MTIEDRDERLERIADHSTDVGRGGRTRGADLVHRRRLHGAHDVADGDRFGGSREAYAAMATAHRGHQTRM